MYGISKMRYFQKFFVFHEYQKHSRLFHYNKALVDFNIKHVSNFVEEYHIYCLLSILSILFLLATTLWQQCYIVLVLYL